MNSTVNTVLMKGRSNKRDFLREPMKIGTRGSPLALAQAEETRSRLMMAHGLPEIAFEIIVISTKGDRVLDRPLSEIGGKGLFTEEIESALLSGSIDIAVHSMKDMPSEFPIGLDILTFLPREDIRDSFVSLKYQSMEDLPKNAVVGTSSLRRKAQLLSMRPDLTVVEFRGNVQTRLKKLEQGIADATFLACAGLVRLGMTEIMRPISVEQMMPAVAQGAIGIEQRIDDLEISSLLKLINHRPTEIQLKAERAFLKALDGSCRTPIGGYCIIDGESINLKGEVLRPDGSEVVSDSWTGKVSKAADVGSSAGFSIKEKIGDSFF